MIKRVIVRDICRVPAKTLTYIQSLIAYKRTQIKREQEWLEELEKMESELLAIHSKVKTVK